MFVNTKGFKRFFPGLFFFLSFCFIVVSTVLAAVSLDRLNNYYRPSNTTLRENNVTHYVIKFCFAYFVITSLHLNNIHGKKKKLHFKRRLKRDLYKFKFTHTALQKFTQLYLSVKMIVLFALIQLLGKTWRYVLGRRTSRIFKHFHKSIFENKLFFLEQ